MPRIETYWRILRLVHSHNGSNFEMLNDHYFTDQESAQAWLLENAYRGTFFFIPTTVIKRGDTE